MRFLSLLLLLVVVGCAKRQPAQLMSIGKYSLPVNSAMGKTASTGQTVEIGFTKFMTERQPPTDLTEGESDICSVHHIQMQRTSVPIGYGLFIEDKVAQSRYEASKTAFPNAKTWVAGGCVVIEGYSPTNAFVYICPKCKIAALSWDSKHDNR